MEILDKINSPDFIKTLSETELQTLCGELRDRIVSVTSQNGGHLSSNLGVVELTVALHYLFDFKPGKDVLIFDVGHQSYAHKILSGMNEEFSTLRQKGGLSGFTKPAESKYDFTISGHASVSLSSAIGFARAKKLNNEPGKVICVIGDGAFTGGLVYEAMNNIEPSLDNLIVILNDNSMSISKNKSAVSRYFMKLRVQKGYSRAKNNAKRFLRAIPLIGKPMLRILSRAKDRLRREIYKSGTMFEEFGFNYVGVADGNNLPTVLELLSGCKDIDEPVFFHVKTQKGKGYEPAEKNPGMYHGVSGFDVDRVNSEIMLDDTFSNYFGFLLSDMGNTDERICAITAAMKYAAGLFPFANAFPSRFFDVGICEEHAVVFAAGLAASGKKPVVAIYSTFLQRGYDEIFHDVVLGECDVLFAIDRAGLVGNDGETHQGIFDAAFLSQFLIPIASPANFYELGIWLKRLIKYKGPAAIRYPRGGESSVMLETTDDEFNLFEGDSDSDAVIITYGRMIFNVLEAAELIEKAGYPKPHIIKLNLISPVVPQAVKALQKYKKVWFVEEGVKVGGIAEHYAAALALSEFTGRYAIHAIENIRVPHMTVPEQFELFGFTPKQLCFEFIEEFYNEKQA